MQNIHHSEYKRRLALLPFIDLKKEVLSMMLIRIVHNDATFFFNTVSRQLISNELENTQRLEWRNSTMRVRREDRRINEMLQKAKVFSNRDKLVQYK